MVDWNRRSVRAVERGIEVVSNVLPWNGVKHRFTDEVYDENERFRRLVDEVEDYAIFMLDRDGRVRSWNKGANRIKGYSEAEIVGEHFSTFYTDEAIEEGLPDRLLTEAKIEGRTQHEGWRVRKDGSRFWASVTITALFEDDRLTGFAKVTRDLTERRQHERRLEHLAHAISHDLRQPLRTMTVDLELVERGIDDSLDEEQQAMFGDAVDGAKRLQKMVDGLLEYTRAETKTATFEPVETKAIVDDVVRDLDALIDERDAEVKVGSLPLIYGDREQLHVVFQNLVENAIKYSEENPRVRVDSERTHNGWRISVADNGIGISDDAIDEIFELFERGHRAEKTAGIGIGLALCRQIVDQHDGTIEVESELDEGTTFSILVPAARASQKNST